LNSVIRILRGEIDIHACARLQNFFIMLFLDGGVNAGESFPTLVGDKRRCHSRYNLGMHFWMANRPALLGWMLSLSVALMSMAACTVYGEHPAQSYADATGGESLERVFWKHVAAGEWTEVGRALASNYAAIWPSGPLDRAAALDQYRAWNVKDYSIGDLKTELNGNTVVVTYRITLNGAAGSQLAAGPRPMMSVWQQQKSGWVIIAQNIGVLNQNQP
jgi:Domain of unknown function (DUF4440)